MIEEHHVRGLEGANPAEVYEHYLGRSMADPFTRILLEYAAARRGERVLDLASGTGSVAGTWHLWWELRDEWSRLT
jgi:hypothetical protein